MGLSHMSCCMQQGLRLDYRESSITAEAAPPGQPGPTCTGRHIRHHGGMHTRLSCLLLLLAAPALAAEPPASNSVRVYRCVASNGAVALQSTPCADSQRQQVLDMLRIVIDHQLQALQPA